MVRKSRFSLPDGRFKVDLPELAPTPRDEISHAGEPLTLATTTLYQIACALWFVQVRGSGAGGWRGGWMGGGRGSPRQIASHAAHKFVSGDMLSDSPPIFLEISWSAWSGRGKIRPTGDSKLYFCGAKRKSRFSLPGGQFGKEISIFLTRRPVW